MKINVATLKKISIHFLFWSWHLVYSIIALALIIPYIVFPMFTSIFEGRTPAYYGAYALVITLLPFVSMLLVVFVFKNNRRYILRYFYGFEMPLLFFILVKIATFREVNFNTALLIGNVLIALAFWLYFLWKEQQQTPVALNKPWMLAGSTLISMVGVYFGVLFFIFLFPVGIDFIVGVFEALSRLPEVELIDLIWTIINPLVWLTFAFILFTTLLFLALPVMMVWLYLKQFIPFIPQLKHLRAISIVLGVIVLNSALFSYGYQQPQANSFALLEKSDSPIEQQRLVAQATEIREGLINAYLAPYRYVSSTHDSRSIGHHYKKSVGMTESAATGIQSFFNFLASPLIYQGDMSADKARAATEYARFFDAPIQKAERETILNAIRHQWEIGSSNEASLLSTNRHLIHSDQQQIDLDVNGAVATLTVTESLRNLTYQNQEAVIHFSLPEDAVVTGLWLSSDKNNPTMYPYVLAPKGAAQAVYKAEVKRRVDPALLEQVGPRQYRLRVYPIPPKNTEKYFQMRFQYQTLANKKGQWPLPVVLEKRNIFWNKQTQRIIQHHPVAAIESPTQWIPTLTQTTNTISPAIAQQDLIFQHSPQRLLHAVSRLPQTEKPLLMQPIAVLIDGSYSMNSHQLALTQALAQLTSYNSKIDFYFCRLQCKPLKDRQSLHFFGNSQTADQLAAFITTGKAANYAAVLLLSDAGSYELQAQHKTKDLIINAPVWLVHLSKTLPYAYDDNVLDLLYRSKGGITQSVKEALLRITPLAITQAAKLPNDAVLVAMSNNRVWFSHSKTATESVNDETAAALQKIVAAQDIKYLTQQMDMQQLNNLDAIHAYAKKNGIISYYSSMLVLVNDQQKNALKKAEESADRFEREVETGKNKSKSITPHDPFAVPSVPEPEEWALLIIISLLLGVAYRRRKGKVQKISVNFAG